MSQLGKYQLVAEIARGGMGVVYLAVAQGPARFSKLHVVKELKPELVEDQTFLEMFLEEARLAARLNHPNIVQTYEVGSDGNRHYIVMDYLDGVTLDRVIRKAPPAFSTAMQLRVIAEILEGLHYAHTLKDFDGTPLGIVHRDISPQNIFITYDGQAKLVDFGIAKALDSTVETRTGVLKGKVAYMAPEQIGGESDARADVFAAGVMIWEAAAHQRMWKNRRDVEVLDSVLDGRLPSLREVAPETPAGLMEICDKALSKHPDQRYQSAAELRAAVEAYLEASPPSPSLKDAATVVAKAFERNRAKMRAIIEAHLQKMKEAGSQAVPTIPPTSLLEAASSGRSVTLPSSQWPTEREQGSPHRVSVSTNVTTAGATPSGAAVSADFDGAGPTRLLVGDKQVSEPRKTKRAPVALLVLFGILGLVGVLLSFAYRAHRAVAPGPVTSAEAAVTTATTGQPPAPSLAPTSTAEGIASSTSDPPPAASIAPAAPIASAAAAPRAGRSMQAARTPPPPPRAFVRPKPSAPAAPAPAGGSAEPATQAANRGFLTIDTYPWTRVTEAGRVLGDTPLVRVPLTPGSHTLTLDNAGENVHRTTVVTVKPGETVSRRLAF